MSPKTNSNGQSARLPFYATVLFFVFLVALEEYYFTFPHVRFVARWNAGVIERGWLALTLASLGFIGTFIALWVSARSTGPWRLLYFALFAVGTTAQYGYWRALGRLLSPIDFLTGLSSPPEMWLDAARLYANPLALLPIVAYGALLLLTRKNSRFGWRGGAALTALVLSLSTLTTFLDFNNLPATAVPAAFDTMVETIWTDVQVSQVERMTLAIDSPTSPTNNIILIIDESVRGDSMSINGYNRPTTPFLESVAGGEAFHNWGIAVSAATCSVASNAALVSGLSTLPDQTGALHHNPTLFHYAKAMGYRTWFFDSQTPTIWNGLQDKDVLLIDERLTPLDLGYDHDVDFNAAIRLREVVTSSTGNFILVNKLGVHFPYRKIYPAEAILWSPVPDNDRYIGSPELINAYDNALRYNVDTFFELLLAGDDPQPFPVDNTTIIYTSDHGQTLGQVEGLWAHCGSSRIEAMVPLFMIGQGLDVDTTFPASHFNIFPTLLDLMNVPPDQRPLTYPLSLLEATAADAQDRYFLSTPKAFADGAVINFDADPPDLLSAR